MSVIQGLLRGLYSKICRARGRNPGLNLRVRQVLLRGDHFLLPMKHLGTDGKGQRVIGIIYIDLRSSHRLLRRGEGGRRTQFRQVLLRRRKGGLLARVIKLSQDFPGFDLISNMYI